MPSRNPAMRPAMASVAPGRGGRSATAVGDVDGGAEQPYGHPVVLPAMLGRELKPVHRWDHRLPTVVELVPADRQLHELDGLGYVDGGPHELVVVGGGGGCEPAVTHGGGRRSEGGFRHAVSPRVGGSGQRAPARCTAVARLGPRGLRRAYWRLPASWPGAFRGRTAGRGPGRRPSCGP